MKALNRPPYSPDLSPCDFWLFSKLKNLLSGKEFTKSMERIRNPSLPKVNPTNGVQKDISLLYRPFKGVY